MTLLQLRVSHLYGFDDVVGSVVDICDGLVS
jgi:hypothetical protein